MWKLMHHLFLPHESNNHRAKILHHSSLLLVIIGLIVGQLFLATFAQSHSSVLGITANVSVQDLLQLTNQKRIEQGLAPLTLNDQLANAASLKGQDMLSKNYWAHNAPDGNTPWVFVKSSGYEYIFAGENLARGFTTASEIVNAWMDSPGHRDNIMSNNYKDIGFAVLTGNLLGDETVLVVQMFGSKNTAQLPKQIDTPQQVAFALPTLIPTRVASPTQSVLSPTVVFQQSVVTDTPTPTPIQSGPTPQIVAPIFYPMDADSSLVASVQNEPLVNSIALSKGMSVFIISVFIFILLLDMIIIEKKKLIRFVGHNIDHIIFLVIMLVAIFILGKGTIL